MATIAFSQRVTSAALLALPLATAWAFAPQLAGAFAIKHYILYLGAFLLVLSLLSANRLSGFSVPGGPVGSALLVWLAGVAISTLAAPNSYLATQASQEVAVLTLLALAIFNLREPASSLRLLENAIIIAGLGVAIFALKQQYYPDWLDPGFSALGKLRIYSTLGNPNLAALVILPGVVLAGWRVSRGSVFYRMGHAACALVLLDGLLATQARHALVALAVVAVVALVWLGTRTVRKFTLALLLIALVSALLAPLLVAVPPALEHSIRGRAFIWLTSLQMLHEHPFAGIGIGNFGLRHMAYQAELFSTGRFNGFLDNAAVISEGHNDFLNWGATAGLAGLLGFAALCAFTLRAGWRSAALKQDEPQLYLALLALMAAMFFIAVTSYTAPALFFWLLLGMTWARIGLPRTGWPPRTWGRVAFAAVLVTLLVAGTGSAWKELRGEFIEARGDRLMEEHDLWLAQQDYMHALVLQPHNARLRKKYATTLFLSGELPQALSELQTARRDSGDLGIYLLEGEVSARLGDLDHAEAVYRQIIAAFPNMVGAHFILGQIYLLQGHKPEAEAEFHKVLDIRPSPFNLNMTAEKIELQKRIVREFLQDGGAANPEGPAIPVPALPEAPPPAPWIPR